MRAWMASTAFRSLFFMASSMLTMPLRPWSTAWYSLFICLSCSAMNAGDITSVFSAAPTVSTNATCAASPSAYAAATAAGGMPGSCIPIAIGSKVDAAAQHLHGRRHAPATRSPRAATRRSSPPTALPHVPCSGPLPARVSQARLSPRSWPESWPELWLELGRGAGASALPASCRQPPRPLSSSGCRVTGRRPGSRPPPSREPGKEQSAASFRFPSRGAAVVPLIQFGGEHTSMTDIERLRERRRRFAGRPPIVRRTARRRSPSPSTRRCSARGFRPAAPCASGRRRAPAPAAA